MLCGIKKKSLSFSFAILKTIPENHKLLWALEVRKPLRSSHEGKKRFFFQQALFLFIETRLCKFKSVHCVWKIGGDRASRAIWERHFGMIAAARSQVIRNKKTQKDFIGIWVEIQVNDK